MNQAVKLALLSGLVFPGVGQLSAGHKKRGWFIIIATFLLLFLMMSEILQKTMTAVENMMNSGAAINIESIMKVSADLTHFSDNSFLNTLFIIFIVGWIASTIDAYRIGKN